MNARLEISVVVPVYNAAPFLADAVRSILAHS
jgi:glycosyltransferase involved in cell wall biosynthesis